MNEHHFEFDECIGTGGFGVVYRARMTTSNGLVRVVAVKALREDVTSRSAVARLRDEARLLAALQHRAIIAVHDLVRLDGRIALVSEYIEGADVAQIVEQAGDGQRALPTRVAVHMVGEVASALAAAWASPAPKSGVPMNLVHRDIKPANIRISTKGVVKLLDFGIAKSESVERDASTGTGLLAGTVGYMAPDRLTEETVQPAADVYALGLVLYEVLTGHRLYRDCSRRQIVTMAVNPGAHDTFVQEGLTRLEDVPPAVRQLVQDMLGHHAAQRPTAAEVEARAEELVETLDGPTARRWARDHAWKKVTTRSDTLVGQTMTASGLLDMRVQRQRAVQEIRTALTLPVAAAGVSELDGGSGGGGADAAAGGPTLDAYLEPAGPSSAEQPLSGTLEAVAPTAPAGGLGRHVLWLPAIGAAAALAAVAVVVFGGVATPPATAEVAIEHTAAVIGGATEDTPKGDAPVPDGPLVDDAGGAPAAGDGSAEEGAGPTVETPAGTPPKSPKSPAAGSARAASAGSSAPEAPVPAAEPVSVTLSSFPFGASVSRGGATVCAATPCDVPLVPGSHTLEFRLTDGRTATEVVRVDADHREFGHRFGPR